MATMAGTVQSLANGTFHAKDENGNIRTLKVGDTIYENDTIYGDDKNSSSSKIEVLLSGNDVIVLSEGQKQLIDSSLIETAFGTEELFFTREGLDLQADSNKSDADVVSNLRDANFDDDKKADIEDKTLIATNSGGDVTDQDTAAGVQVVEDATDVPGIFQARDGNITNIVSDLRDAQFPTQNQININGSNLVIGNLSVNDISVYETEGFLIFTVSLDRSLASDISFDYATSAITASNNGVDYSDVSGRITIPAGSTNITIRVPVTDDYLSDNGETMKITISNVVGNAIITKPEGIGTILDNPVNNPSNGTPGTPTEPGGYGQEDTVYAIITGATTVNEGNTTTYTVKLVDKDGNAVVVTNPTTVTVKYTNVTTQDGDTEYNNNNTINVTIPANGSSNTFTVESIDDYFADNGEKYNVAITKVDTNEFENVVIGDKNGNNKNVTTTILDNPSTTEQPTIPTDPSNPNNPDDGINYGQEDTVYAIITGATTVNEGNTTTYTVKLVDKDGNAVVVTNPTTVTVKYTNVTTQDGDTEYNNNNTINVTIPANGSSNTFTVESIDDYFADNGEKYNVAITKVDTNEFENVVIGDKNGNNKNVTTTILDNPSTTEQPTIPTDPSNPNNPDDGINYGQEDTVYAIITGATTVNEGNTTTYTVKLVDKDGNAVVVTNPTTVTVKYTNVTTQDGDTEYNNNNTINVTIPANGSSNTFTVESIDDYFADNGEKYNVAITKVDTNEFENVIIGDKNGNNKDVTTTILDDTDNTPNNPNDGVEANHESVIIKLVACDASGNPILEADGKTYKIVNEVNEGDNAKYMALAFEPNSTTFTTETKLSLQGGTVTVDTSNGTAIGVISQTKEDGSEDFILVKDKVVNIGVAFEVVTVDDYISDNNEIYTVSINSGSYTHPTTPIYENVTINNEAVTTTIKDNSNPVDNTTPHNPNDPTNHNQESDKEIVLIKLFAADENGNVLKDGNGNYLLANEAEEGTNANYIAYAFENGTTTFNDSTKFSIQTGTVNISFQNDTATGAPTKTLTDGSQDFNNTPKTSVSIGQSFSTEVFKDLASESTEKYKVVIDSNSYSGNYESVNIDTTPVTTTIHDEKLFVKIEAITDTTNEGGNLKYKIVIVNKDGEEVKVPAGKTLTVDLNYEGNTAKQATENTDYTPVTSVTISAGTSYTEFEIVTKDDYYAEGDEGLKITINNIDNSSNAFENIASHTVANGASSDKITTIGTIKDNPAKIDQPDTSTGTDEPTNGNYGEEDTVYAIITGTQTIKEGDTSTNYTVKLVDKDGNTVTPTKDTKITVTYNNITTQNGDTQYDNSNEIEVTILANTSEITFTVETKDDVYKDDGEQFNLTITDIQNTGEFENVKIGDKDGNQKNVISTIKDNTTPGTETNIDDVKIVLVAVPSETTTIADITDGDGKLNIDNTNETPEGGKLYYMAVAVDNDGKPLSTQGGTVTVNTTDDTAKGGNSVTPPLDGSEDYSSLVNKTVNIGEVFEVQTNDDYIRDNNEKFTVKITNPVNTDYESPSIDTSNDTVTSTIKDNPAKVEQPDTGTGNDNPTDGNYGKDDTVYVKITQAPSTIEGGNLVHTVTLVDKNGDPVTVPAGQSVTVTLEYTAKSSTGTGTFTEGDLSTIVKTVTIDGGTNHKDFTNISIDDFTAEGDEIYNVTISSVSQTGAFENVAISSTNSTTGTIKDGVILGDPVNAKVYEDGLNTSATTENDLGKSLGITNPNADTYTVSFDKTITTTDKTSNGQVITYSYNTDGTILTATRADNEVVFTVELKKDGSGNDVYDFKLIEPMDHEYGNNGKNEFDMPFSFNVTSNGTTSSNKTFNVTVVDSVPSAEPIIANTKEDTEVIVRLADDDFKNGEQVTINGVAHNIGATGIAIYEKGDTTKQIGSLTINTNGTVTFTPIEDYSNHNTSKSPEFTYTVKDYDGDEASSTVTINVKPVADAITITPSTPSMIEDAGNTTEGTAQVALGLTKPTLSKDQTDENASGKTGDQPEKNGEITLTFTNGDKVAGAKIFNGATEVADITTANQTLKVIIINDAKTGVDYDYHHADITIADINTPPAGTVYLTKDEYEGLIIQHAEDNDTNIKIKIDATSYELDDDNKPLSTTDADLYETATANMTVKINPATDDISLIWDNATGGTISKTINDNDTFTFTGTQEEGYYFNNPIDLDAILSNTSGGLFGTGGTKADLDGSEKRTYTVTGIPEGTVIILGTQTAVANESGIATLVFNNTNNQAADPEFSMKLPEHYSGTISNAKITLSVQDKGVDSGDTAGATKTAEVYFNVVVTPVADIATIQVSQAVGYEDAGRTDGNSSTPNNTIDNPSAGIPFNIKVSSDDKDGSETFNVKIEDIPNGSSLYVFDKSLNGGIGDWVLVDKDFVSSGNITVTQSAGKYEVVIKDYQNDKLSKFIPAHNDDTDYKLKVSSQTVDNNGTTTDTSAWSSPKDIEVIVKNVADAPVGTDLNTNINVNEDNQLNLKDVYTDSTALKSYDDSEVLTVKIDLPAGFTIHSGSQYYIEDGMYVVKASDITADKIMLNVPENFSGDASFNLTYVTTEKAGENDSKTWYTQNVGIFVEPKADDVTIASGSTIYEDGLDKDGGSLNTKIDLKPTLTDTGTTNGTETVEGVKILASSVPTGYTLYSDSGFSTALTTTNISGTDYYVLTKTQWENGIYAKNSTPELVSGDFTLKVTYTVKDTNVTSDTQDFIHDHKVIVKAVTDQPSLGLGTITTTDSDKTTITGTTVTVKSDANADFTIPVTTTSDDKDSSEKVQEIVISGVPKGVEVVGATYYGYSGSEHNGIWVISNPSDKNLDSDGASQSIQFKVNKGADFESRPIIITTYTKDEATADTKIESDTKTFTLDKSYTPTGTIGNPPKFDLTSKTTTIFEDNDNKDGTLNDADIYNLGKSITVTNGGGGTAGNWAITITDFPEGTKVEGKEGVNIYTYEQGGKTHYVITGTTITGNAADINTALSNVIVTPPTDMNTGGDKNGQMTFSATISTSSQDCTYKKGTSIGKGDDASNTNFVDTYKNDITPVTDEMTIAINVADTNEDAATSLTITLSNPSDGTKTELIGNSITIKIDETWKDDATGGVGTKGTLTDPSGKYNIVDNGDDTYTITPKNAVNNFKVDTPISGLVYTPAKDRDGDVKFEVSVQNKEGNSIILTSKGDTTIKVNPVVDMKPEVTVVTATGTEDTAVTVGSTTLGNPVKLEITAGTFTDGSEKFGNIILDEVPNGFTVWYNDGTDLVMATNIGITGGTAFDVTPGITGDATVTRNKWLVPATADGSMPEVYINAPTNWSGDFDFDAIISVKEQNLATSTAIKVDVSGKITPVADGVTIAPTNTFGKAFEWIDLKLNANMKDVDGSETMSLELSGLGANAQFRVDGTDTLGSTQAVWDNATNKWTISGIKYDQINNIQFTNDKDASVKVDAWTQEIDKDGNPINIVDNDKAISPNSGEKSFVLDIKDVGGILSLDKDINLDFSKLSTDSLKGINTIDLSISDKNKLENISLQDVLNMTNDNGELIIKGTSDDEVSFKGTGWSKTAGSGADFGFDIYSNSNDTSVKVKVEQNVQDQII